MEPIQGSISTNAANTENVFSLSKDVKWNAMINSLDMRLFFKHIIYQEAISPIDWYQQFNYIILPKEDKKKIISKAFNNLPDDIYDLYNSKCPLYYGKKWGETHNIVWIPEGVMTESFLKILSVKCRDLGIKKNFCDLSDCEELDHKVLKSAWIAITKRPLPYGVVRPKDDYQRPSFLEAIICSAMTILTSKNSWTDKEIADKQYVHTTEVEFEKRSHTLCVEIFKESFNIVKAKYENSDYLAGLGTYAIKMLPKNIKEST